MPYQPIVSTKALVQMIREHVELDPRIGEFRIGDVYETETIAYENYPLIIYELDRCRMLRYDHGARHNEYTIRLYCFTQRMSDWSNIEDGFSDCQNILQDLLIRMQDNPDLEEKGFFFPQDKPAEIDYVVKTGTDALVGVTLDLTISTPIILCGSQLPEA
jgi:hypothetical protein